MSGVSNGQNADEISFNNAFMARNGDTSTTGKVDLLNGDVTSGPVVENVQAQINNFITRLINLEYQNMNIEGIKSFLDSIRVDLISEYTPAAGVTIDGLLLKDGLADGRDISADGASLDSHLADVLNPHATTKAQVGLGNVTDDAQLTRAAGDINSFTEKTATVADDLILIEDSQDSFAKKKVKKSNFSGGSGGGALVPTGTFSSPINITSSGINYIEGTDARQNWFVATSGGEVIVTNGTPIGSAPSTLCRELWIWGTSDENYPVFRTTNNALLLNGDFSAFRNFILKLAWNGSIWVETGRSE